jgi:predicted enzyme related to lactoylglutathione lyase
MVDARASSNPRWAAITIDCLDPKRVAEFWSLLLGTPVGQIDRPDWYRLGPFPSGWPAITFQPVPEPKAGKARIHLDIRVDDLVAAQGLVESLGGTNREQRYVYEVGTVAVMADPEGNEFCLVALDRSDDSYP